MPEELKINNCYVIVEYENLLAVDIIFIKTEDAALCVKSIKKDCEIITVEEYASREYRKGYAVNYNSDDDDKY